MTMKRLRNYPSLVFAYARLNLRAELEYRGAFISQVAAMILNDAVWLAFWWLFFERFQVLRGWQLDDVVALWSITAAGFGIAFALMGNALSLATIIARGELDVWMLHPRELLSHMLLGKMNAMAWGDVIFGYAVYLIFARPDPLRFVMFVLLSLSVAAVFIGLSVLSASLSFYLGNSSTLTEQWRYAVITFATYPPTIFDGAVKLALFTIIPAGFISYLPVQALRNLSLLDAALAVAGAAGILAAGVGFFYRGLRKYESGNLLGMRG
jgi:ABC-2 type transport system permease protein